MFAKKALRTAPLQRRDAWKDNDNPKFNAIVFKEMIIEE